MLRNRAGGIYVGYGNGNEINDNRVSGNGGPAAIVLAWANIDNSITANRLVGNSGDGIHLESGLYSEADSSGNVVRRNLAVGNADDGVESASRLTTIVSNRVVRNGDLGIEAVAGVTDGGGNRAFANGNPLQCLNVFCR